MSASRSEEDLMRFETGKARAVNRGLERKHSAVATAADVAFSVYLLRQLDCAYILRSSVRHLRAKSFSGSGCCCNARDVSSAMLMFFSPYRSTRFLTNASAASSTLLDAKSLIRFTSAYIDVSSSM